MPYAADVYTVPPGTPATTLTPVDSSDYNAFVADIEAAQNAARPVVAGGTGASSVIGGWDALAKKGTDIATAASINLTTATGPSLSLTGTVTVTGVTLAEGSIRVVRAAGAFQITASANLLCNGSNSVNMSVSAEDTLIFRGGSGGVVSVVKLGSPSAASLTTQGVVELATAAEFRTGTDTGRALVVSETWAAGAEVTLTDAATIAVDMATFLNAVVTLGGNRTLGQPSNTKNGQSGVIRIKQDGTGSRTLAYHADWEFAGGAAPVLSTAANAEDLLFYQVLAANRVFGTLVKAVV